MIFCRLFVGAAEWAALSEKERQAELLRRRLEQKRLLREGKLEEAARVLGEGFAADANLKKLMGQNRARYEEMMKEKLARRRERIKMGLQVDDEEDDDELLAEFEEGGEEGTVDAKTLLEDLQKRHDIRVIYIARKWSNVLIPRGLLFAFWREIRQNNQYEDILIQFILRDTNSQK